MRFLDFKMFLDFKLFVWDSWLYPPEQLKATTNLGGRGNYELAFIVSKYGVPKYYGGRFRAVFRFSETFL